MKKILLIGAALAAPFVSAMAQTGDEALLNEARTVATALPPKLLVALQDDVPVANILALIDVAKNG